MNIREYIVDCPQCKKCRMRLRDLPSKSYFDNFLQYDPEAKDYWSYTWLDRCLWCGAGGEDLEVLPAGVEDYDGAEHEHLDEQLRRYLAAGGSNPANEIRWREALAYANARRGDLGAAFEQLQHALSLSGDRVGWCRVASTLAVYAGTDEQRTLALAEFERAIATTAPGVELAAMLLSLAGLHAGLRDFQTAWGAAEQAFAIYGDAHDGHGIAGAAYELVALGAMLGRDTSLHEVAIREHWASLHRADSLDAMITAKKSQYR